MWSCDQSVDNNERSYHNLNFKKIWPGVVLFQVQLFRTVWPWNFMAKGLKVRNFVGLIPTFREVTKEKMLGGGEPLPYWIRLKAGFPLSEEFRCNLSTEMYNEYLIIKLGIVLLNCRHKLRWSFSFFIKAFLLHRNLSFSK